MGLDTETVVGIVVLTLLGVFLTGPGMWSEKWGWGTLRRKRRQASTRRGSDDDVAPHPPSAATRTRG